MLAADTEGPGGSAGRRGARGQWCAGEALHGRGGNGSTLCAADGGGISGGTRVECEREDEREGERKRGRAGARA